MDKRLDVGRWGDQAESTKAAIWGDLKFFGVVIAATVGIFIAFDRIF